MNADNILFRCSSFGYIMTEPRSKSETLSETTKTHLVEKFVSTKYGRETDKNYQDACAELEKVMKYDDVPMEERVNEITIERNDGYIERLYARVKQCREYMNAVLFKELL